MPSEVTWMNGVVAQFHQDYPAYAKTQVNVKWIPWVVRRRARHLVPHR